MKMLCALSTGICVLLLPLFYSGCDEDDQEDKLPPVSMEGNNTFGCLVNGQVWLPRGGLGQSGLVAELAADNWVWIGAENKDNDTGMIFNLSTAEPIQTNRIYELTNDTTLYGEYFLRTGKNSVCFYKYDHVVSGNVTITRLDTRDGVISGLFELKTYNPDCGDTIRITEGRFDLAGLIH